MQKRLCKRYLLVWGRFFQNDIQRGKLRTSMKMHSPLVVNSLTICVNLFFFFCKLNLYRKQNNKNNIAGALIKEKHDSNSALIIKSNQMALVWELRSSFEINETAWRSDLTGASDFRIVITAIDLRTFKKIKINPSLATTERATYKINDITNGRTRW